MNAGRSNRPVGDYLDDFHDMSSTSTNDNVVDFVGLAVQRLLFPILRVIFPKVHLDQKQNKFCKNINLRSHRDLAELGSVDAVGGGGDVPVVEENPPALVR